jgi:single-stranded DNA-binding protein
VKKYVTEIKARELIMLGRRDSGTPSSESPPAPRRQRKRAPAGKKAGGYEDFQAPPLDEDDDLPF